MNNKERIQAVIQDLQIAPIVLEDRSLHMPTVPEGFNIEYVGADYKQIIDDEGKIYHPLIDTDVIVDFKISYEKEEMWTKGISITVPGIHQKTMGGNSKPYVIPEIKEWVGAEGQCVLTKQSIIRIDPVDEKDLLNVVTMFKEEIQAVSQLDLSIEVGGKSHTGDIFLRLSHEDEAIGEEGYIIEIDDSITVNAIHRKGIFYATRTLLQILKREHCVVPKGIMRDYPRYKRRGFMLDVGRRFSSMKALKAYVKLMAWYKMNDFHIHLNDNVIHFDDTKWREEYAAFRLECDTYKGLTAKDGYYTKQEFGDLIDFAETYCVDIVPEIDTPAHCLAFVQYDDRLALGPGKGRDHLNIMEEETYKFIDKLFHEYMDGEEPTFRFKDVHIGTDEYFGSEKELEAFRYYTDRYLKLIKAKGRTPRLWGNLSRFKGKTPIISEGVIINIWSLDWVDAIEMIKQGYDIINSDDSRLYIVPNANYYRDYLDKENLFNEWEPNIFRNAYTIPAGHPQLLGGAFSIWNDMIKIKVSEEDIYDRAKEAVQVIAQKLWNNHFSGAFETFERICKEINISPDLGK